MERHTAIPSTAAGPGGARPDVPASRQMCLDVREDIRQGNEPIGKIMASVKALEPDMVLVLRAPFEPAPLYAVLGRRGFAHWTERLGDGDWSVWFYRDEPASATAAGAAGDAASPTGEARTFEIDVRGLEPPQPMVQVLEAAERLRPGDRLVILHERRPTFLYPQLDERGLTHETEEPAPGLVRITVWHGATAR
jgi:uncharacterized protein (DUF2249 family)